MSIRRGGQALRQIHVLFNVGTLAGQSDAELLDRFVGRRGEVAELAFAALVERHGPMVWRVCRRMLADPHDADDAFQATFLVLVRRAASIRSRESLASWLLGVAVRVAGCARSAAARRRRHERNRAESAPLSYEPPDADDLGPLLHEEIARLPEPYRAAVVLCDLEGLSYDEAARRLDWPIGTVKSRLNRGRGRLRSSLTRRGLAPTAGAMAALLATGPARAFVPASLADRTIRAALQAAAYPAATGAITASVAALTEGVIRTMIATKLKAAATAALSLGLLGVGLGVAAQQTADNSADRAATAQQARDQPSADSTQTRADNLDETVKSRLERLNSDTVKALDHQTRAELIRRLTLDLTGALPSEEEIEVFLGDKSPDAARKLRDRLFERSKRTDLRRAEALYDMLITGDDTALRRLRGALKENVPTQPGQKPFEQVMDELKQMVRQGTVMIISNGPIEYSLQLENAEELDRCRGLLREMYLLASFRIEGRTRELENNLSGIRREVQALEGLPRDRRVNNAPLSDVKDLQSRPDSAANPPVDPSTDLLNSADRLNTGPGPAPGLSTEDRLREVERKLDQILKALGKPDQPAGNPRGR